MHHPAPPDALGNPRPAFSATIAMPEALTERDGQIVTDGGRGSLSVDLAACRRILVVRLDFIGDWVLMQPFLDGLRRSAPKAEITAVVLTRVYDLARSCRFVDRVVAVEAANAGPVTFFCGDRATLGAFVADYEGGAFDLALVPRWDVDYNGALRVADASGAPRVIGFSEACTAERSVLNRGDDRFYSAVLLDRRDVHEVEHKLGLLAGLGATESESRLVLHTDPAATEAAERFLEKHFGRVEPFLAVAPFAVGRKLLPLEQTAGLARLLAERYALPLVIIGSPVHSGAADDFVAMLGVRAASATGLPLSVSAALVGQAEALVGMDSGPAHIAAALGTPVVVVFGHPRTGHPSHVGAPERFRPWGDPDRVLVIQPDEARPPCVEGCEVDAPHCIAQLTAEGILPRVATFLDPLVRPYATVRPGKARQTV